MLVTSPCSCLDFASPTFYPEDEVAGDDLRTKNDNLLFLIDGRKPMFEEDVTGKCPFFNAILAATRVAQDKIIKSDKCVLFQMWQFFCTASSEFVFASTHFSCLFRVLDLSCSSERLSIICVLLLHFEGTPLG
jgi:hypothetical protein